MGLAAIYLPDVGHGFVKDDFGWVARSQLDSWPHAVRTLLRAPTGFFRPLVSLTFGFDRLACGVHPFCYGVTNFVLLVGCAIGIGALASGLGLPPAAGLVAAALWAFNFHGINMAVVWISGRTALVLTLCATAGAAAFARGWFVSAATLILAAMLAKEEGIVLPAILIGWIAIDRFAGFTGRADRTGLYRHLASAKPVRAVLLLLVALATYLGARSRSGAFTPSTAPTYYQLDFSLERFLSNALQYADRALTFDAAALIAFVLVARPKRLAAMLSATTNSERRAIALGSLWLVGGFALTVFLPVRSSLYACFPSVGASLVTAAVLSAGWRATPRTGQTRAAVAALVVPFLMWPVYHARNRRSVEEADLSASVIDTLKRLEATPPSPSVIVLKDDRSARPSLDAAFGTLLQEAVELTIGPKQKVWIDPPPTYAAAAGLGPPLRPDVILELRGGHLQPRRP